MPVKNKQNSEDSQPRRRSMRIQTKEDEKKRTNLKELLKRGSSTLSSQPKKPVENEHDGDFVFKRTGGGSQSKEESQLQKPNGSKRPSSKSQSSKAKIRKLSPEDMMITPDAKTKPKTPKHTTKPKGKKSFTKSNNTNEDYEEHSTSFQVSLPVSDTPIIRRNKELRNESNGMRRSSLGNRGKRVSSIGNGFTAIPHDKVPTTEFYKHLDSSLPDPHKMRQLLTWCAKRVFDEDKNKHIKRKNKLPNEELTALNIAKVIKEEIVRDLVDGKINISWWNRTEDDDDESNKIEQKLIPNEKNVKNARLLKDLSSKLKNLQDDSLEWERNMSRHAEFPVLSLDNAQVHSVDEPFKAVIDQSLISEIQGLEDSTFNEISSNFEISMDSLNDLIHKLKSSSSIRQKFIQIKSSKLNEILDHTFDDETISKISNNDNNKGLDTHQLLKGISRLDK